MSFIGNVIWFLLIGWWESIVWAFYGLIFCITIIGIPIGVQCFKIAKLGAVPFGRTIIDTGNTGSTIANIIWFIVAGLWIGLSYLAAGIALCCTLIGIPIGLQCFKLTSLAFCPFGKEIIPNR